VCLCAWRVAVREVGHLLSRSSAEGGRMTARGEGNVRVGNEEELVLFTLLDEACQIFDARDLLT